MEHYLTRLGGWSVNKATFPLAARLYFLNFPLTLGSEGFRPEAISWDTRKAEVPGRK